MFSNTSSRFNFTKTCKQKLEECEKIFFTLLDARSGKLNNKEFHKSVDTYLEKAGNNKEALRLLAFALLRIDRLLGGRCHQNALRYLFADDSCEVKYISQLLHLVNSDLQKTLQLGKVTANIEKVKYYNGPEVDVNIAYVGGDTYMKLLLDQKVDGYFLLDNTATAIYVSFAKGSKYSVEIHEYCAPKAYDHFDIPVILRGKISAKYLLGTVKDFQNEAYLPVKNLKYIKNLHIKPLTISTFEEIPELRRITVSKYYFDQETKELMQAILNAIEKAQKYVEKNQIFYNFQNI